MSVDVAAKSLQKQLNSGASSIVLVALLDRMRRPMYGYEIARELERQNGGSIPMKPGALYPVLRSLEKQGLLASHTELSEEGRARRYYKLTNSGAATIKHWKTAWKDTKKFVDTILGDQDAKTSTKRHGTISKTSKKRSSKGTA